MKLGISFLALLLIVLSAGCGSAPRTLQSVTASPASADAKDFPDGRVQFIPTGIYNKPPIMVTPQEVTAWAASENNIATVDQNGVAECVLGQVWNGENSGRPSG